MHKKKNRLRPGTGSRRTVIRLTTKDATKLCLRKSPVQRLIRGLMPRNEEGNGYRITRPVLEILHESLEAYLIGVATDARSFTMLVHHRHTPPKSLRDNPMADDATSKGYRRRKEADKKKLKRNEFMGRSVNANDIYLADKMHQRIGDAVRNRG